MSYRYLHLTQRFRRYVPAEEETPTTALSTASDHNPEQTHGSYGALLFHSRWKERRAQILERDKHQCVVCQRNENLQVHHRQYHFIKSQNQYKPPWDYEDHLLISLCEPCHKKGHNQYKVPTINL